MCTFFFHAGSYCIMNVQIPYYTVIICKVHCHYMEGIAKSEFVCGTGFVQRSILRVADASSPAPAYTVLLRALNNSRAIRTEF